MARQLATAAINAARDAHYVRNPVTGLYERATLLEGSRTNVLLHSENLADANWTKTRATITSDAATAPDGTQTMDKLVEDTSIGSSHFLVQSDPMPAGSDVAGSIFLKSGERTRALVYVSDAAARQAGGYFDLATGTKIADFTAGGATLKSARIVEAPNGCYRIEIAATPGGAGLAAALIVMLVDAGTNTLYTGDGASGIYAWGGQIEIGAACCSSYIPTAAATVTRVTDSLSFPFAWAPQEMTLYAKFIERGAGLTGFSRMICIGNTADPRLILGANSSGTRYRLYHGNGSSNVQPTASVVPVMDALTELKGVLYGDGSVELSVSINGTAEASSGRSTALPLAPAWSTPKLWLGSDNALTPGFAAFLAVKVARGIKTLDQMRALARAA